MRTNAKQLEQAVLRAAKARMRLFLGDDYETLDDVIKAQRGKRTPAAKLIRATAKWMKATS